MKRLICLMGMMMTVSFLLTGCSNAIPEMDAKTQTMVVEYAAGIVRKYDQNHISKLKELSELPEEAEQSMEDSSESDSLQPDTEVEVVDRTQENQSQSEDTLEGFLQLDAVSFSYTGYETTSFYPSEGSETYFVMNATDGNELLVLKFTVQNLTQEEALLDMLDTEAEFKISVNGNTKYALTTMLLNDLSSYQGTLAAGESEELVLVCEIAKEQVSDIASLSIIVKNEGATATISLN